MMLKNEILDSGDTHFLEGQSVHKADIMDANDSLFGMKVIIDKGDSEELSEGQIVSSRKLRDEISHLKDQIKKLLLLGMQFQRLQNHYFKG